MRSWASERGLHFPALDDAARKAEVGRLIFEKEDWDLFCLVFVETDAAQHYYLHTGDEQHPLRQQAIDQGLDGTLLELYKLCDQVLGDVLAKLDDNTTVIVVSDHGNSGFSIGDRSTTGNYDKTPYSAFYEPIKRATRTGEGLEALEDRRVLADGRDAADDVVAQGKLPVQMRFE